MLLLLTVSFSGCINETKPVNQLPIALLFADATYGKAPFNVSFTGSGTDYDGAITSYHWDFGDGSTSDSQNPNHTYVDEGKFVVNLTVTDDDEETGSDILKINVIGNYYPIAYASAGTIKGRAPLKVQFYGEGKDEGDGNLSYHWDFEDTLIPKNGESNKQNPTHTYWREGIYKAKLTVKNDDGSKNADYIEITVEKNLVLSMLPKNAPPYTPNNSIPASGSENVSINAKLCWTSGDPNFFDKVSYAVYFGDSTPPPRVVNKQPGTTYDPKEMNHNTTYYWRIVARDMLFHFVSSPIWCFTTK